MNPIGRGIRNAFRNPTRLISIIIIIGLAIGLSLAMLIARQAVSTKINNINSSVGTKITITPAGVVGFSGGGNPLTQSQINPIYKYPHVVSISESLNDRLNTTETNLTSALKAGSLARRFLRNSGSNISNFNLSGINFSPPITVEGTNQPSDIANSLSKSGDFKLLSGQLYSSNSSNNVALIGTDLATKNNLKVGSTFSAYGTTISVSGIFSTGNKFNDSEIMMPLLTLQNLSSQQNDLSQIIVQIDSLNNLSPTTNKIESLLGSSASVTNSIQEAQNTITPLKNIQTISIYSLIGSLIAGSIIIFLIILMIVRERKKEIGILKAIGASNLKVIWQFMVEALTLTLIGAVIGIVIGTASASPITNLLVSNSSSNTSSNIQAAGKRFRGGFNSFTNNNTSINLPVRRGRGAFAKIKNSISNLHTVIGWSIILYGILAALVIALIGSVLASAAISRIRPSDVIRTE